MQFSDFEISNHWIIDSKCEEPLIFPCNMIVYTIILVDKMKFKNKIKFLITIYYQKAIYA